MPIPPARIADMDFEGVDVNLTLPSGWFGTWSFGDDIALEMAMYRAYHRWMEDYCGAYPERLGGVILAGARDIEGGLAEIRRWGKSRWAWGMMVYAPVGMPLDHPALEPFYAEAAALDLAVVLHTFTVMPPYAPGGQDTWDNLWLQRSAAHPWCGMRNMAALIGSGVMDRYPDLRVGTLEAGHGWLPFWMARLDEHAETIKAALPELKHRPSEYVMSGRYFQSIEIPEGARLTNAVADLVGDDVLMYASDYPHGESHFPEFGGASDCAGRCRNGANGNCCGTTPSGFTRGPDWADCCRDRRRSLRGYARRSRIGSVRRMKRNMNTAARPNGIQQNI